MAEGYRNAWQAGQAVNDAMFPSDVNNWDILDGMGSMQKHSHHYVWICYAIVWGIERYNNQKLVARAIETFLSFLPVHAAARGAMNKCCQSTEEELKLLANGDYTPEELWGIGGNPSCPECWGKGNHP